MISSIIASRYRPIVQRLLCQGDFQAWIAIVNDASLESANGMPQEFVRQAWPTVEEQLVMATIPMNAQRANQ